MSVKDAGFVVLCGVTWFVIMPLFLIGGTLALLAYALFSEINECLFSAPSQSIDRTRAREIARRVCIGH